MLGWWKHPGRHVKLPGGRLEGRETGIGMIEVLLGIAILGVVGVSYLSGLGTGIKATITAKEQAIAESLVRSEAEYVKRCGYQYDASEYPIDPTLTLPAEWTVPTSVVPVHGSDDGLQKVTVTAKYQGETVLSIAIYKVAR